MRSNDVHVVCILMISSRVCGRRIVAALSLAKAVSTDPGGYKRSAEGGVDKPGRCLRNDNEQAKHKRQRNSVRSPKVQWESNLQPLERLAEAVSTRPRRALSMPKG